MIWLNSMGSGLKILHMISIIISILISFQSAHILIPAVSSAAVLNAEENYFNAVDGLKSLHFIEDNTTDGKEQIEKVSGEDDNAEKEPLILEKFRVLLGLKSFKARRTRYNGELENCSPSPSPSPSLEDEAEAPAPVPAPPLHAHSHPPHHPKQIPPAHRAHRESRGKGRVKKIIVAVLVSTGATSVICVLGFIWFCLKFRKPRKRSARTVTIHGKEKGSRGRSNNGTASKVSINPGLDLFYLDSIESSLEPQGTCLKQSSQTPNISTTNQNSISPTLLESEGLGHRQLRKSESGHVSYASGEGIVSVHGDAESGDDHSNGGGSSCRKKFVSIEAHFSDDDDESFHSFCESHSSNVRLSNASAGSFRDAAEVFSPNVYKIQPSLPSSSNLPIPPATPDLIPAPAPNIGSFPPPISTKNPKQEASCSSESCQKDLPPPPPPPPPPPRPPQFSPSPSSFSTTQLSSKASCSYTLANFSSPRNSDSSSGSNQTPQRDLQPPSHKPPNPPPPPGGIPPPPCPPPFLRVNSNSLKTPPPPPSQLSQFIPLGKDGAPLPKLKPLHWDKVRAAPNRSTVWDKLRSSSFELDEKMIESLFGYNLQTTMKNDEAKSKSPSPSKHVLEPKRLQNITILSKALNATAGQVCDALQQGDGLCLQQLEALAKMVPTDEEEAKLSSYNGDINELGSAERFVKAMLDIPFAFLRIEAMLYKETFEDEVVHLRKSFSMLEEACKELRSSRLFLKLLEAVLKTGNRMNVGTIRGGARAFKLDALLKLSDVKGTDGKTTLLHFVVQEMIRTEGIKASESIIGKINLKTKNKTVEEREEGYRRMGLDLVSGLSTELCNVKKTATVDMDVLASSVSNLSDGKRKLQNLVNNDLGNDQRSRNFVGSMKSFLGHAEKNLKELQEDENRVLLQVREITEYFHGDVSKDEANPLRIFVIVRDFLGMLDHICKELRSAKIPRSPNPLSPFR